MAKVAFLGLGVMGYPMAGHLKNKGGHEVTVYNRTAAKADQWVKQHGGKSAPTPKAAAEGQDFVMACVGNDNDLREVTLGPNGAFAGMGKGKVFVDHTTASAEIARELYAAARKGGFDFIDHFGVTQGVLQTVGLVPAGAGAETVTQALLERNGTPGQTTVQTLHTGQTLLPTDYVQSFGSWVVQKHLHYISNDAATTLNIAMPEASETSLANWPVKRNRT